MTNKVKQDSAYVSNVTQADVDAFKALPGVTVADKNAQFVFIVKGRLGVDGKPVKISEDMVLAPARYGFADKAAAQVFINSVEMPA